MARPPESERRTEAQARTVSQALAKLSMRARRLAQTRADEDAQRLARDAALVVAADAGATQTELAELLGIPQPNVSLTLRRARERVAQASAGAR